MLAKKNKFYPADDASLLQPAQSSSNKENSSASTSIRKTRGAFTGVLNPTPGDVYFGYYNKWHAVLVLPSVYVEGAAYTGLPGTIEDENIGLINDLPECYYLDPLTGLLKWQEDYEDGGPSVTERQFPVVFFDGLDFASRSSVAWLPAKDLEVMDMDGPILELYPERKSILKYLETRSTNQPKEPRAENSEPMDPASGLRDTNIDEVADNMNGTDEAEQPLQIQDEQLGSHPPDMARSEPRADDQGGLEENNSPPLFDMDQRDLPQDNPVDNLTEAVPQTTNGLFDPSTNNITLNYTNIHSQTNGREVSEGTSIDGRFRSFMNGNEFHSDPTSIQRHRSTTVVSIGSDSTSRLGSVPPAEAPSRFENPGMTAVPAAPSAPMQDNQDNIQLTMAENAHLTQPTICALQLEGLLSESDYQALKARRNLSEVAANSMLRGTNTEEQPVNTPPAQSTQFPAQFQTTEERPAMVKTTAQFQATEEQPAVIQTTAQFKSNESNDRAVFVSPAESGHGLSIYRAPPILGDQTSGPGNLTQGQYPPVQPRNGISGDTASFFTDTFTSKPQNPFTFSPAGRPNIVLPSPKDLNADAAPRTNELPPINPVRPNNTIVKSHSQHQMSNVTPALDCQEPLLHPNPGPTSIRQFPSQHLPPGPSPKPRPFHRPSLNTHPCAASGLFSTLNSSNSAPHRSRNAQEPHGLPQNHTTPSVFTCPRCLKTYKRETWRDKHIFKNHSTR